jgi:hypothetical protein
MRYTEIKPAIQLARFIECYWTLESDGSTSSSSQSEPILPDGCVELILNFGAQFVEHYDGKVMRQPVNFLVGQMTKPMLIAPTGSVCGSPEGPLSRDRFQTNKSNWPGSCLRKSGARFSKTSNISKER